MKTPWPDQDALQAYKQATGDNPWARIRDAGERKDIVEEIQPDPSQFFGQQENGCAAAPADEAAGAPS